MTFTNYELHRWSIPKVLRLQKHAHSCHAFLLFSCLLRCRLNGNKNKRVEKRRIPFQWFWKLITSNRNAVRFYCCWFAREQQYLSRSFSSFLAFCVSCREKHKTIWALDQFWKMKNDSQKNMRKKWLHCANAVNSLLPSKRWKKHTYVLCAYFNTFSLAIMLRPIVTWWTQIHCHHHYQ